MSSTLTQTLRLVVTGDASRATRELGKVAGSAKRMGTGLRTAGTMAIGVLGPVAAGLAAVTKEAIDEENEMALLSKTIQNNTKDTKAQVEATEEWITAQQNATGIADGELRPALAALVAVTKDTGKAQDLLSTAMDIAVAKGKPVVTIAEALAKAQNGNIGILSRYGIATRNAAGETLTFDQVMQNAAKTFGGAASTAATTTSGKFSILKAKFADMREEIGTQFIPIALKLGDTLSKAFDYLMEHKEDVRAFFGVVGDAAKLAWAVVEPLVKALWKVIEGVVWFGPKVKEAFQKIWDALQSMWKILEPLISRVGSFIPVLAGLLVANKVAKGFAAMKTTMSVLGFGKLITGAGNATGKLGGLRGMLGRVRRSSGSLAGVLGKAGALGVALAFTTTMVVKAVDAWKQYREATKQAGEAADNAGSNLVKNLKAGNLSKKQASNLARQILNDAYDMDDKARLVKLFHEAGIPGFAKGGDFITRGATPILVGEAGPERVTITPLGKRGASSGDTYITLTIPIYQQGAVIGHATEVGEAIGKLVVPHLRKLAREGAF